MIARPRPRVLKGQSKGTVHSKAAVAAGTSGALCLLFALVRSMWHCEEVYMQEPTSRWGLASLRLALRRIKEEQGLAITEAAVDQEAQDMASEPGMVAIAGLRGWGLGWLGHWVLQCGAAVTLWLAHGVLVDSIGSLGFGAGTRVMRAVLSWARALGRQYVILQSLPQSVRFYEKLGFFPLKGAATVRRMQSAKLKAKGMQLFESRHKAHAAIPAGLRATVAQETLEFASCDFSEPHFSWV